MNDNNRTKKILISAPFKKDMSGSFILKSKRRKKAIHIDIIHTNTSIPKMNHRGAFLISGFLSTAAKIIKDGEVELFSSALHNYKNSMNNDFKIDD